MKVVDDKNMPEERLATTDEKGWRVYLFPAAVSGFFRRWRTVTQVVLIAIFLIAPWIKINGVQSILLDIPNRQFAIFGLTFWAHDAPILFFILLLSTLGLGFVTAIWGRVWCGWACPQTVFIDGVFRRIERLVVGNYIAQKKLATSPMSLNKFSKLSIKWALFLAATLVISHSFIAYFVGSERLWEMAQHNPEENWVTFVFMAVITLILLFDFTWFREQFCIIMCPYGRIQSILMDDNSLAVVYDDVRGEPRRAKEVPKDQQGDCVSCGACVRACPTGIDIRRGVQLECIACTACIDACDEIMEKVKKPKGLIRYDSVNGIHGKPVKKLNIRTALYSLVLVAAFVGLVLSVSSKGQMDVNILRGNDSPYTKVEGQDLYLNHYKLVIKNRAFKENIVSYEIDDKNLTNIELVAPLNPVTLKSGEQKRIPFFVKFSPDFMENQQKKLLKIRFTNSQDSADVHIKEISVVGPVK